MSGIQIIIPLDALPPGTALTPEALIEAVGKTEELTLKNRQLQSELNATCKSLRSIGPALESILNDLDGMQRAQALRQLVTDAKGYRSRSETDDDN